MNLIGFIFYYLIGMVGAWIGLLTLVYVLQTCIDIKGLKRDGKQTKLDRFITGLYDWIGLDINALDFHTSSIKIKTAFVCGLYAAFGPYALILSFLSGLISYFVILGIQSINHK